MLAGLAGIVAGAQAQTITSTSERVMPGETLSINGDGFTGSSTVYGSVVNDNGSVGTPVQFTVTGQMGYCIQAQVPSNMSGRLWQVQVQNGSSASGWAYVNRARPVTLDTNDVQPGGLLRIYGRNMKAPGSLATTPMVRIRTGSTYLTAPVVQATPYCLTARIPASAKWGLTYRVFVRNGPGGATGEVECPVQVNVVASQRDYLSLNIPWSSAMRFTANVYNIKTDSRLIAHAAGDGFTNDAPALRNAITMARQAGGGVVYIPTGTYRVDDGTQIQLPSNVVLKGDGPGNTNLQFGYRYTSVNPPTDGGNWWLVLNVADLAGVMNMSVVNLNGSTVSNATIGRTFYNNASMAHRFFFQNVDFQLRNGKAIYLQDTSKGVFSDCNISTTSLTDGPLWIQNLDWWTIRRTTFSYRVGRIWLLFTRHSIFEGNTVNRDNTFAGITETGGVETSYSNQLIVQNNTIRGVGPNGSLGRGDGELLMSQKSSIEDCDDLGQVSSATSTTVSDQTRNWPAQLSAPGYSSSNRAVVAIVAGKGVGQWRNVVGHTGSQLSLDRAWTVVPDTSSTYSLSSWSNYQQFLLGNNISNSTVGISLYDGACDTVVDSNNLLNSGYIMLKGNDVSFAVNGSTRRHNPGWNVAINNNSVTNNDGSQMAQIIVMALSVDTVSYGNLVLGVEVRNNTLISGSPVNISSEFGSQEGLWNWALLANSGNVVAPPDCNVGTVVQGNSTSNIGAPYHSTGSSLAPFLAAAPVVP